MGIFDSLIGKLSSSEAMANSENISKVTADKANSIIKELSGANIDKKKKIIDNLVLFTGASGGTGVSTLVANIGYALAKKGLHVLVIDLNILFPSQYNYLGIKQSLEENDLLSFLFGECSVGESIKQSADMDLVYANNRSIPDMINASNNQSLQNFSIFLKKVRNLYDIILIDCPMRIDDMLCNTAMYYADSIYCVWDEGLSSIANTERVRRALALTGVDSYTKMRAILNKRTAIRYNTLPMDKMNLELVGILPFSSDVIDSSLGAQIFCDKGKATSDNGIEFAKKIVEIADKVAKIGGLVE